MKSLSSRALLSIIIVSSLVVILAILAVLQYRWSGQISEAERARMESSLTTSTTQFRQEFNRELQELGRAFQLDAAALRSSDWQHYAQSCDDLLSGTEGRLVNNVYLWIADNKGGSQLLELNREAKSFDPISWPPAFETVRDRYSGLFANLPRPRPEIPPFSWTMISHIPLMLRSLRPFQTPAGPATMNARFLGFLMVQLSMDAIRGDLLPELAQRYFGGPDYDVAIINGRDPGEVLYQSDPKLPPAAFATADARISLFDSPRGPRGRRMVPPTGELRPADSSPPPPPPNSPGLGRGRGAGPVVVLSTESTDWELVAKHRGGSLEAVVASMRRRNLAISFGILILLGTSMALIIGFTQRERRLAQLQMDFVTGVSHELRTPLAVICSAGDNLAEGVVADSGGQVRQYGELVRDEGWRLTGMVEQILQFASVRSGRRQYNLHPARIDEIVENTLAKTLPRMGAAGFQVEKSIDAATPLINVDAAALEQCIQNLITNALKYSGDGRWLSVRTGVAEGQKGAEVLITVEDRGIGIEPADLPHIFDPFYRGRAVTAAQIHGTGLGLCMTREIAVAMGGSISVKSTPGKGSAFTLHFPALPPVAAASSA
jgi:signal transduction histidine kinase